jgi:hypothetical protein
MAAPDRPGETDTERRFGVRFVGVNRNRTRATECRAGEDDEAQEIGAYRGRSTTILRIPWLSRDRFVADPWGVGLRSGAVVHRLGSPLAS